MTAIFTGYISGTTLTVSSVASGTILVPMSITGSGISANTYITSGISGAGSTGTYTVSVSQTSGSSGSQITITGTTPLILANDYNTIYNTISPILGRASTGYGQILNSSTVSSGNTISTAQWNALQQDITNVYQHQLNNTPSPALTTASSSVKIKETDRIAYLTMSSALANSGSGSIVNGITYPGCYAIPPNGQLATPTIGTPTSGGFPFITARQGSSRPWGGTSITNPSSGSVAASGYISGTTMTTITTPSGSFAAGMTVTGSGVSAGTVITAVNVATFSGYIVGNILTVSGVTGPLSGGMLLFGGGGNLAAGTIVTGGGGSTWTIAGPAQTVGSAGSLQPFSAYSYTVNNTQTVASLALPETLTCTFNVSESNTPIISNTVTVTFPSGTGYSGSQAAKYFFNSGGSIQFSASMSSPGTISPTIPTSAGAVPTTGTKNYSWYTILNGMGTVTFSYYGTSPSGSGTGTGNGWQYFLNNAGGPLVPIFTNSVGAPGSSVYAPNQYTIWAQLNSAGNQLTFQIMFEDLSSGFPVVTGTANSTGASNTVFLSSVSNIIQGTVILFKGTGGNGLSAGSPGSTYYVASVNSGNNSVTLATSYNNATAATPITSDVALSTGSLSGTTFQAAGTEDFYKTTVNPYDIDEDVTGTVASEVNISYASGNYVTMAPVSNLYNYLPAIGQITSL